jgi:polysaccharide biosynthesis protein PslH
VNILIVSAQFPYPPRSGFATRVYQLARQLAAHHDVTLLSYISPHEHEGVAALEKELSVRVVEREHVPVGAKRTAQALSMVSLRPYYSRDVYSGLMQHAITELCATTRIDVVQLESSYLCGYAFPRDTRLVLDEHNIEYEVFRRMSKAERSIPRRAFNRVEHARFRRFEQRWWARVDGCIVTSDREAPIVRARAPQTPVAVVPNGVDLDYFAPSMSSVEPHTVVFNGILTYRPNLDAVRHLIEEIWPLVLRRCPEARLKVVGRMTGVDVRDLLQPGVELLGEVPDIRPHLQKAAVVAVPIRIGGGTRLKVVEGLAMGKAMVSTSLGCEGVAVRDGEHLLIGDDARAFASRVLDLFDNPAIADKLGRAGRGLVERNYSWDLAGARLQSLYRHIGATGDAGREAGLHPRVELAGHEV